MIDLLRVVYDISQGTVATRFRCGGTSDYDVITNSLLSKVRGKNSVVPFFSGHRVGPAHSAVSSFRCTRSR